MLCLDGEDIALVASTNHLPKVWILHAPTSKWPKCDYPIAKQGMICKHVMKFFKMLDLHIQDNVIVQKTNTFHGVQTGFAVNAHINFIDITNREVGVNEKLKDLVAFKKK
jgi:hypothetical protein